MVFRIESRSVESMEKIVQKHLICMDIRTRNLFSFTLSFPARACARERENESEVYTQINRLFCGVNINMKFTWGCVMLWWCATQSIIKRTLVWCEFNTFWSYRMPLHTFFHSFIHSFIHWCTHMVAGLLTRCHYRRHHRRSLTNFTQNCNKSLIISLLNVNVAYELNFLCVWAETETTKLPFLSLIFTL